MDPDPVVVIDLQDANKKQSFLLFTLQVHLHHFSKKSQKRSTSNKIVGITVFLIIFA
jgi:hypothetical protein